MTGAAALTLSAEPYGTPARLQARIALHELGDPAVEDFHRWTWRFVTAPDDAAVLEIGVGTARHWRVNADRIPPGWRLTLSDRSPGMVAEAGRALAALGRAATCLEADAAELPLPDDAFDLAFAHHVLFHLPEPARAVAELRRVLRPGGRLLATTNAEGHLAEVTALLRETAEAFPAARVDVPGRLSFDLGNGAALLCAAFERVERHVREDTLTVTEPAPLVRYLLSMVYARDRDEARAIAAWARRLVARRLRTGPIRVRRVSGVFVAS